MYVLFIYPSYLHIITCDLKVQGVNLNMGGGGMDEFGEVGQQMNAKKLDNRKESENG
jgi:hypothetical protein